MKISNLCVAVLLTAFTFCTKALCQTENQWGNPTFGARLSICLSNSIIPTGSNVTLTCTVKNFSTNDVIFEKTDSREIYRISIVDDFGKTFEINDPDKFEGSYHTAGKLSSGESYQCGVPLSIDASIKPGLYKMTASQTVVIFTEPQRQGEIKQELKSNLLDLKVE